MLFSMRIGGARVHIKLDDLTGEKIVALINEHLTGMLDITPAESVHALPLEKLKQPNITFWSVWDQNDLMGCGALKELTPAHAEIKSMRTTTPFLRKGVASKLIEHLLKEAKMRGYKRVSLETGASEDFFPARKLYEKYGFSYCGPFADYEDDPNSVFMTLYV